MRGVRAIKKGCAGRKGKPDRWKTDVTALVSIKEESTVPADGDTGCSRAFSLHDRMMVQIQRQLLLGVFQEKTELPQTFDKPSQA